MVTKILDAIDKLNERSSALDTYVHAWQRELRYRLVSKTHLIDALVLTTQRMMTELDRLRLQVGEVWHWIGDGTDDLTTLTCPVLIQPDKLQALITAAGRRPHTPPSGGSAVTPPPRERKEQTLDDPCGTKQ